jgi:hypothetical protein
MQQPRPLDSNLRMGSPLAHDLWQSPSSITLRTREELEDSLTCSLTGKYSQSPSQSKHRRARNAIVGKAKRMEDPRNRPDPLLELSIPETLGVYTLSDSRAPVRVRGSEALDVSVVFAQSCVGAGFCGSRRPSCSHPVKKHKQFILLSLPNPQEPLSWGQVHRL